MDKFKKVGVGDDNDVAAAKTLPLRNPNQKESEGNVATSSGSFSNNNISRPPNQGQNSSPLYIPNNQSLQTNSNHIHNRPISPNNDQQAFKKLKGSSMENPGAFGISGVGTDLPAFLFGKNIPANADLSSFLANTAPSSIHELTDDQMSNSIELSPLVPNDVSSSSQVGIRLPVANPSANAISATLSKTSLAPDFVRKLYTILEDETTKDTICWSHSNDSIIILNPTAFASNVLPLHFKHNKFASFVRQLNKHNFHRVKMTNDSLYGETACEYKHPMFIRDRVDLLEKISRQSSKPASLTPTQAHIIPETAIQPRIESEKDLEILIQGQKLSFFQIKELERRVDFLERELSNCFQIVAAQSKLIKDLLYSLPPEARSRPEIASLTEELKWSKPALLKSSNERKALMIDQSRQFQTHQHQIDQQQFNLNQQQQQLNQEQDQLNSQVQHHTQYIKQYNDTSDWWQKPPHSLASAFQDPSFHFQNQEGGNGAQSWSNTGFSPHVGSSSAFQYYSMNGPGTTAAAVSESSQNLISSLKLLILVNSPREQRQISDILLELFCLTFKFALDISYVFKCFEEKQESYDIVILDHIHESSDVVARLRNSKSDLFVIFLTDPSQDPTPPPSENDEKIISLSKPPTVTSMRHCLTKSLT